jgi:hypothetical protein
MRFVHLFQASFANFTSFEQVKNSSFVLNQDHGELNVVAAEAAFATAHYSEARDILESFFRGNPQRDSLYCRAKLVMSLVLDFEAGSAHGDKSIELRKTALKEVLQYMLYTFVSIVLIFLPLCSRCR